jgi:anti-anti-sigma factor
VSGDLPSGFSLETLPLADEYLIRLSGALDANACDDVIAAIRLGEHSDGQRIVIDIDGLEFIDSIGLRLLLAAQRRAELLRRDLRFTHGDGYIADMLRFTAFDQTLSFVDEVPT